MLDETAQPWLKQCFEGFAELAQNESAEYVAKEVLKDPVSIFKSTELAEELSKADIGIIRACERCWTERSYGHLCVE